MSHHHHHHHHGTLWWVDDHPYHPIMSMVTIIHLSEAPNPRVSLMAVQWLLSFFTLKGLFYTPGGGIKNSLPVVLLFLRMLIIVSRPTYDLVNNLYLYISLLYTSPNLRAIYTRAPYELCHCCCTMWTNERTVFLCLDQWEGSTFVTWPMRRQCFCCWYHPLLE